MARSVGEAAAQGVESGFGMGLQLDRMGEEKRARAFQENRQLQIDQRAESDAEIRRKREDRQERRLTDAENKVVEDRAQRALLDRNAEIETTSRGFREQGKEIPPALGEEYDTNRQRIARMRKQQADDYFSRLKAGQNPGGDSKDAYVNWVLATGMLPEDMPKMEGYINDFKAAMGDGSNINRGLLLSSINGLLKPTLLSRGIGSESPHGGTIVEKEIIHLIPSPNDPSKLLPVLRVYVDSPNIQGPKMVNGATGYYDAPLTENGTSEEKDRIPTIDIARGMDWIGQVGVAAAAARHPEIAALLEDGAKKGRAEAEGFRAELNARSNPVKKTETTEKINMPADSGSTLLIKRDAQGKEIGRETIQHGKREFRPTGGGRGGAAVGVMQARLDQLDADYEANIGEAENADEAAKITEQYKEDRRAVLTSIKPAAAKPPTNAEVNAAVRDAVKIAAGRIGLVYDAGIKDYKNQDGTPVTPAQRKQLSDAEAAAIKATRDITAKGERPTGTQVESAGGNAKKTVKFGDLK